MEIVNEFCGRDLTRLARCLEAMRSAGMVLDKSTTVGFNPHSGYVYVFSEDWPGTITCSPSFAVRWSCPCPDCGEESFFEDFEDMESHVKESDGKCSSCS